MEEVNNYLESVSKINLKSNFTESQINKMNKIIKNLEIFNNELKEEDSISIFIERIKGYEKFSQVNIKKLQEKLDNWDDEKYNINIYPSINGSFDSYFATQKKKD